MVFPGPKLFLSVVLNISLEENWPTFVYLASDKLWRDPSEQGGGRGNIFLATLSRHDTQENLNLDRKQTVQKHETQENFNRKQTVQKDKIQS